MVGVASAPVIEYHESAHSIVFRDNERLRKLSKNKNLSEDKNDSLTDRNVLVMTPLELNKNDEFEPLLQMEDFDEKELTEAEKKVFNSIMNSMAVVKTVKYNDWSRCIELFSKEDSFRSSTSLLPYGGKKMRCYGKSLDEYCTGLIFFLPRFDTPEEEDHAAEQEGVYCWPSGYAARTEFNIDSKGKLLNGREEARKPLSYLRLLNESYVRDEEFVVAGKKLNASIMQTVPYNEIYLKIGGKSDQTPSYRDGIGNPVAVFSRSATYGHLVSTLRNRARMAYHFKCSQHSIPILLIEPLKGVRILTNPLQEMLWSRLAKNVNPFQNRNLWHKTKWDRTDPDAFQQKYEELLDITSHNSTTSPFDNKIRSTLTSEECAKIAGGFGATDESVIELLMNATLHCSDADHDSNSLQAVVNEGLTSALRAGDYHTSRQLLILYSLVAATKKKRYNQDQKNICSSLSSSKRLLEGNTVDLDDILTKVIPKNETIQNLPPPLDTDQLRSATTSDGLLAVLGAAQLLRAMQDETAKQRIQEVISAVEEWVDQAKLNLSFRLSSWRDQRAAQGDLEIAMEGDSQFQAFLGTKAITNRKIFAQHLRHICETNFIQSITFWRSIYDILNEMHSPCLRLELLQYVFGMDNRYSIAHLRRSVELAMTCMSVSVYIQQDGEQNHLMCDPGSSESEFQKP